jgi:hypothetical protein
VAKRTPVPFLLMTRTTLQCATQSLSVLRRHRVRRFQSITDTKTFRYEGRACHGVEDEKRQHA